MYYCLLQSHQSGILDQYIPLLCVSIIKCIYAVSQDNIWTDKLDKWFQHSVSILLKGTSAGIEPLFTLVLLTTCLTDSRCRRRSCSATKLWFHAHSSFSLSLCVVSVKGGMYLHNTEQTHTWQLQKRMSMNRFESSYCVCVCAITESGGRLPPRRSRWNLRKTKVISQSDLFSLAHSGSLKPCAGWTERKTIQ